MKATTLSIMMLAAIASAALGGEGDKSGEVDMGQVSRGRRATVIVEAVSWAIPEDSPAPAAVGDVGTGQADGPWDTVDVAEVWIPYAT